MQICEKCGQENNNYEERCIYCGEFLYIAVDHDDRQYDHSTRNDYQNNHEHSYVEDISDDLINELSNSNNEAASYMNLDDNPFTQTVDKNSYHENSKYVNDDYIDREIFNESDEEMQYSEDIDKYLPYEDKNKKIEKAPKKQHILDLEDSLKRKIKRNKKLENSMGLMLSDIEVDVTSIKNPIEISGRAHFNQNMMVEDIRLSVICLDVLQNRLDRRETILENPENAEHVDFNISIHPNIHKIARIILLPETIKEEIKEDKEDLVEIKLPSHITNHIFIEQMYDIERKIGMRISNTSILLKSDNKIEIVGEIYLKNPDKYSTIILTGTCYNHNNEIIATESTKINTRLFLGFDTLRLIINDVDVRQIERVRIYPTLQGLDY